MIEAMLNIYWFINRLLAERAQLHKKVVEMTEEDLFHQFKNKTITRLLWIF